MHAIICQTNDPFWEQIVFFCGEHPVLNEFLAVSLHRFAAQVGNYHTQPRLKSEQVTKISCREVTSYAGCLPCCMMQLLPVYNEETPCTRDKPVGAVDPILEVPRIAQSRGVQPPNHVH